MSRPPKWNSPTESIRVPAHAVEQLFAVARKLDATPPTVQANGLVSGDRPTGSRWLPEEAERMATLQFAGLSRFLEPDEFLRAAIAHYALLQGWSSGQVDQLWAIVQAMNAEPSGNYVQNSRTETQLLGIGDARYLLTYDPDDERLDPLIEKTEAALTAAGLTRREDRLLFAVALAQELERRGELQRIKEKAGG